MVKEIKDWDLSENCKLQKKKQMKILELKKYNDKYEDTMS
jgi:hypothetical protein